MWNFQSPNPKCILDKECQSQMLRVQDLNMIILAYDALIQNMAPLCSLISMPILLFLQLCVYY